MKRKNPSFKMYSFGKYSAWDRESKLIPKILEFTTEIKAAPGIEFGYVLQIKHGKGETVTFKIDHPPFTDKNGNITPHFTGEQFIRTNDFEFYIGDSIWEPVEDKLGNWEITTFYRGKTIAQKTFKLK